MSTILEDQLLASKLYYLLMGMVKMYRKYKKIKLHNETLLYLLNPYHIIATLRTVDTESQTSFLICYSDLKAGSQDPGYSLLLFSNPILAEF